MRPKIISAIVLLILGFIISIISWNSGGLESGYLAIWIGYPLIIAGILLFFANTGVIIFFIGWIFLLLSILISTTFIIMLALIILTIGIVFSIVEGILRIFKIKSFKKKK